MKPIVIAVAITGSVPRKRDNPARSDHAFGTDRIDPGGIRSWRLARPHSCSQ